MKTISTIKRLLAAAVLLFSLETNVHANDHYLGIHDIYMNSIISGDGFGVRYAPSIGVRVGHRFVVSGGPLLGMPGWKNMGYEFNARYFLMKENESYSEHCRMSVFFSAEHFASQDLSASAVKNERMAALSMNNDEATDFTALRFSGWEYAGGFALTYHFNFGLLLRSECSIAYYNTDQLNMPEVRTVRDHDSVGLRLGAGIGWSISR